MNAYLVLTICSVAASLVGAHPAPPSQRTSREADPKKTEKQSSTETPILDLNQFCELLESEDQKAECLEYVRRHVKQVPASQDKDKVRANQEKIPLDLQVFIPSENSWYLQDSNNPKFLGKPLLNVDKRPEDNLDVSTEGERRTQQATLVRL